MALSTSQPAPWEEPASTVRVRDIAVDVFRLPLAEVLTDAGHGDHTHFELITVTVQLSDGSEGTGYT